MDWGEDKGCWERKVKKNAKECKRMLCMVDLLLNLM